MARVGVANFIHSSMKPVPCDEYWNEVTGYSLYTHPYHSLNHKFPANTYRNVNTTSNDVYGSTWRILHKEDPDLDPAGVSTGVHGRMMKMGQIPFTIFDEINAQLRGREGFGQTSGSCRPGGVVKDGDGRQLSGGKVVDTPKSAVRSTRAGSEIVGNVPSSGRRNRSGSRTPSSITAVGQLVRRTPMVPGLNS